MANRISVHFQSLDNDKRATAESVQAMKRQVNGLYNDLLELNAMWEGPANAAFTAQFEKDRADMEALCAELEQFTRDLEYASTEYKKCESQVSSIVAAIRV